MKRTLSLILSLLMVLSMFTGLSIGAQSVGVGSQDDPHTALAGTGAQDVIARSATRESGDVAIPQKGDADLADTGDETINSVGVNGIVVPTTGATPTYSASVPYGEEYQIKTDYWTNGVWWFNETDGETMTASDTFEAGKNYTATVLLKTINDRISFASNVSAYLNDKSAKVYNYGDGKIAVYRTFTCHDAIDAAYVTGVIEPVAGATPTYSASVPSDKGYRVMNSNSTTMKNGVGWYNWTDYEYMTESDTFEAGKQYEVIVELDPDDGYSFASNVSGFLNGFDSSVYHYPYNNHIDVSRIFTCPAVLIDSVSVTGVAEPYAGAAPTYSASVPTGKGYQIKTDYWTNGVWWYNSTDDKTMTASDTFEAGKEYNLTVLLKTAGNNISFASYVSGSLNNKSAKVYNYGDGTVAVYLTFTFPSIPIDSVAVTEITAPTSGAYPDMSCKLPSNCGYKTVYYSGDITWYTEEGDILNPDTDKFVDGEKYNAQVELLALDGYEFAESGLTGTINGTSATVRVLLPKKKLTVSRWFTCSDSIIKKVSVTGITKPVAGNSPSYSAVVSGGNGYQISNTNNTFTKNGIAWFNMTDSTFLFPANNDKFAAGKQYGAFITLETTSNDFQFSDEPSATVNGKPATISAKGKNSITVFYIFNGSYILGDADDNGEIESVDATFVQRYAASILTPYITQVLMQGDVDGDGNITVMDATAIQYYLANMKNPYNIGKTVS